MPSSLGELVEYITLPYFINTLFSMGGKLEISALKTGNASCATSMIFPVGVSTIEIVSFFLCVFSFFVEILECSDGITFIL